jgi:DNA-binding NtrC family response regulator
MMKNKWKILIVDDDLSILRSYQKYLESEGYTVFTADDGRNGYIAIEHEHPDLVLLDINMPVKTGLELLEDLNRTFNKKDIPLIVMLTAFGDLDAAVKAMNLGAYEFLTKPVPLEKLRSTVECALETLTLKERVAYFIEPDNTPFKDTIIGRDPLMVDIYKTIGTLKGNKATILVTGESGTGKEMVAKAIHENTVPDEPCIAINCAAVPENLIESELMGYVKGAFTGANANREGKLEAVRGGTLVLDEISEMPYEFQTKLLRVIQEKDFYPIGATEKKRFNGRIVALTNKNLKELVEKGKFREDLFYRLNVITISVPPLRDHLNDLEMLILHFIKKANFINHTSIQSITKEAVDYLRSHTWPGNIRELENTIQRASIKAKDKILTRDSFSFLIAEKKEQTDAKVKPAGSDEFPFPEKLMPLRDVERNYIEYVLKQTNWHKGKTAELLGITRPTLDKRIEEFGLHKDV